MEKAKLFPAISNTRSNVALEEFDDSGNLPKTADEPEKNQPEKIKAIPFRFDPLAAQLIELQNQVISKAKKYTDKFAKGLTREQIEKVHTDNNLENNQFKSAKQFMSRVMYQVPLYKLYQPLASCQFNEDGKFSPVLVKINDATIQKNNGGLPYLLQVWSLKGELVYEKPLQKPVANWNISGDHFMFLEDTNSTSVWLVKLFEDKAPVIYQFELPESVVAGNINSYFDEAKQNFVIPPSFRESDLTSSRNANDSQRLGRLEDDEGLVDKKINQLNNEQEEGLKRTNTQRDLNLMRSLGEVRMDTQEQDLAQALDDSESISQRFSEQIIKRAPDKMIDYLGGFILLAYRSQLIYINLKAYRVDEQTKSDSIIKTQIQESELDYFDLEEKYKIIAMQELGTGDMSCIILEHLVTRELRFLRIDVPTSNGDRVALKFFQLGILVNQPNLQKSPLIKYRSVAKLDQETKKHYQVGLALRENGSFEVYSDFMLVNEYYNPLLQCVDISTDFDCFIMKFVDQCDKVDENTKLNELDFQIRQVRHAWRNRISFQTSRLKGQIKKWDWVIHKRISKFFNMYTQILNYNMYMLVAHRNMISVYDMVSSSKAEEDGPDDLIKGTWIKTIHFDEGSIRQMYIKKRPKLGRKQMLDAKLAKHNKDTAGPNNRQPTSFEKYRVMIIIGSDQVAHMTLNWNGETEIVDRLKAPGRVINFKNDNEFDNGTAMLIDNASTLEPEFIERGEAKIYSFPFNKKDEDGEVSLYCLKMSKFYKLLSNKDAEAGGSISHDSYFYIMQSDRSLFQQKKDAADSNSSDDEDQDPVAQAFRKREKVNLMIITSLKNDSCKIFPLVKEYDESNKDLNNMRLITNEVNSKDVTLYDSDRLNKSNHLQTFFLNTEKNKELNKNFAQVTEKQINIYDENQKPKVIIKGLNIRDCAAVHDSYLYTISDAIVSPYTVKDYSNGEIKIDQSNEQESYSPSGFFVYDMDALFEGKITKYKLASSVGGFANNLDDSKFGDRISFIQSFDNIVMIPFPHLNLLSCVGMGHKSEYLIWREKNGFFSALDRRNNLLTWAILTGQMLYSQSQTEDAGREYVKKYEVYRADEQDIVHTQNFYNFEEYSLSLLKSKQPVDDKLFEKQPKLKLNKVDLTLKKDKNLARNENGNKKQDKSVPMLDENLFKTSNLNLDVEIVNSQQRSDVYHFKVFQLESHEDTKQFGEFGSKCKLRFHFFHELLQYQNNKDLKDYDWDVNSAPSQRLYLSRDTKSMMEVTNNFIATVYKRTSIDLMGKSVHFSSNFGGELFDEIDDGQQVKWKVDYRINRFPRGLAQQTSVNFLFSPNFKFQFDFNFSEKQFHIKETSTQHVYYEFPIDMIDTIWNNLAGENSVKIIASRFKWESDRTFRIVNRSNLDCLFELCSNDADDLDPSARYIKLLSVVKIDNLHANTVQVDSAHLLLQPCELKAANVLDRLIRQSQQYKTGVQHALNTNNKGFRILQQLNKIDYLQPLNDFHASFDIDLTYTWLDWRIMDLIRGGDIKLTDVDHEQQLQICFNILPGGKSFLHLLAEADEASHTDQILAYFTSKSLFEAASKNVDILSIGNDDGCSFEIPILPDIYGQTALDHCLGLYHFYDKVFKKEKRNVDDERNVENIAMAEVMFNGIQNYGFMHSSFFIVEAVTRATALGLPSIIDYFCHRLKSVEHSFTSQTENAINKDQLMWSPKMGHYARQYTQIWVPENETKKKIFNRNSALQPMNMRYLDLPFIYRPNELGFDFIYALKDCDAMELFNLASVQIVIDCHASYWNRINYIFVGLPMIFNLFFFWYWSNVVLVNIENDPDNFGKQDTLCRIFLTITAVYLVLLEISAIIKRRFQYLNDMARLFNLITPILILTNVINENRQESSFWTIQTWAALAIWFRFLLYLRTLSTFSWLVRMIVYCVLDMFTFLVVFTIGVIAFADAFLSIEQIMVLEGKMEPTTPYNPDGSQYEKYLQGYVVAWQKSFGLAALGSTGEEVENYRESDWIVVLIACLFNIIVLLNLLIAIISETYSRIADDQVANGYKEKAQQISMMQDQLLGARKFAQNPNELVFIAKKISSDDIDEIQEEEPDRIGEIQEEIKSIKEGLKELLDAQKTD